MHRYADPSLGREEFTQFQVGSDSEGKVRLHKALRLFLFEGSETSADIAPRNLDSPKICQFYCHPGVHGPAPGFIEVGEP